MGIAILFGILAVFWVVGELHQSPAGGGGKSAAPPAAAVAELAPEAAPAKRDARPR